MRRYFLPIAGAIPFCTVIWFADPFLLQVFALWGGMFLLAPAAVILVLYLVYALAAGNPLSRPLKLLGGLAICVILGAATIALNRIVQENAVNVAKAFPARVAPILETFRQVHGSYPASLDQLPSAPSLPRLMHGFGYRSDGKTYTFDFPQPGGLIDVWEYNSQTGEWHLST